jgi:hypothetical protein
MISVIVSNREGAVIIRGAIEKGIFWKIVVEKLGGCTYFWTGKKKNLVQSDLKRFILSPFCLATRENAYKPLKTTTSLDLFWALFRYFSRFSQFFGFFCNFSAFVTL